MIGLKISRHLVDQSEETPDWFWKPIATRSHTFPALFFSHVYLPRELFGSLYYLNLLWLTTVVTLVLLLRYSLKTKTTTWLTQVFLILPLITDWNILDSWTSVSLTHRAIINHFTPKIDSWAAVNHLTSLSSEQVCWHFLWSECEPFLAPKVRAFCVTLVVHMDWVFYCFSVLLPQLTIILTIPQFKGKFCQW